MADRTQTSHLRSLLWQGLGALVIAVGITGCAGTTMLDGSTANVGEQTDESNKAGGGKSVEKVAEGTNAASGPKTAKVTPVDVSTLPPISETPKEVQTALAEARKLKSTGKSKEAMAYLKKAGEAHPGQRALGVEHGLMALELGQPKQAQQILAKTAPADAKDWRALSGLGIAHASQGQQADAQRYFKQALEIEPNNATVLNNLAMSLILDRKVDEAEPLLRKASAVTGAKPEVARNLALAQSLKAQQVEARATP